MDVLLLFMLGQKDCFSFRAGTPQLTGSINSLRVRHADIKDGDIRMVRFPFKRTASWPSEASART